MKIKLIPCNLLTLLLLLLLHSTVKAAFTSNNCPASTIAFPLVTHTGTSLCEEFLVDQQTERIRQNTGTIMYHIFDTIIENADHENRPNVNKRAASADLDYYKPNDFWGDASFSRMKNDGNSNAFENHLFQFTGGLEKRIGSLYIGSELSYMYADLEVSGKKDTTSHGIGITPYIAYLLNDFLYVSVLSSYYYTDARGGSSGELHNYVGEINLNAFKQINSFIIKGRSGVRYNYNYTDTSSPKNPQYDEWTTLADLEIGYKFSDNLIVSVGSLYEHTDRSESSENSGLREDIVYMRLGLEYQITPYFSIETKIETDLNDNNSDIVEGSLNLRLTI